MKVRFSQAVVVLFFLMVLTGCDDQLIPNFKLPVNDATRNVRQVATAVDAKGWKHTLWNECDTTSINGNCRLVYARYNVSPPAQADLKVLAPVNYGDVISSYIDPDIAVTNAGVAYGVWRAQRTSSGGGTSTYTNCYQNSLHSRDELQRVHQSDRQCERNGWTPRYRAGIHRLRRV